MGEKRWWESKKFAGCVLSVVLLLLMSVLSAVGVTAIGPDTIYALAGTTGGSILTFIGVQGWQDREREVQRPRIPTQDLRVGETRW